MSRQCFISTSFRMSRQCFIHNSFLFGSKLAFVTKGHFLLTSRAGQFPEVVLRVDGLRVDGIFIGKMTGTQLSHTRQTEIVQVSIAKDIRAKMEGSSSRWGEEFVVSEEGHPMLPACHGCLQSEPAPRHPPPSANGPQHRCYPPPLGPP